MSRSSNMFIVAMRRIAIALPCATACQGDPAVTRAGAVDEEPGPPVSLELTTAQESYAGDEPARLSFELTNVGAVDVGLSDLGHVLRVESLARDGEELSPAESPAWFEESYDFVLQTSLETVAPGDALGGSLDVAFFPGELNQLRFVAPDGDAYGLSSAYDIGAPGGYELRAWYEYRGQLQPDDEQTFTDRTPTASVTFTIDE